MNDFRFSFLNFQFNGRLLDLFCFFFVVGLTIRAVLLLLEGTPQYFQRFGSFMVASAIVLYFVDKAKYAGTNVEYGKVLRFPLVAMIEIGVKLKVPSVVLIEGVLLLVGTLIWGYGDLFHCWNDGKGWKVCY
ncbi:hypothetical protein [Octadecabacter antarcticus]|nr:hypothetical protein [Octadecabacter antarcticus]